MSKELKIALLCNNRMAFPLLQKLQQEGVLCAVGVTDRKEEVVQLYSIQTKALNIPFTVFKKKGFEEQLEDWVIDTQADAVMVLTFPWKIPSKILSIPARGFINYHLGVLPQMRGADPVFECIRQQMTEAGATLHLMDDGLDTGPIIMQEKMPLYAEMNYGVLFSQLVQLSISMCDRLINDLRNNIPLKTTVQDETLAQYWPQIQEQELYIDWETMDSSTIKALVLACNPLVKGAPCFINNWVIGLCDVSLVNLNGDTSHIKPGTIIAMDPQHGAIVYCKDGKGLKLEVIYTEEGVFPGYKLSNFAVATGTVFTSPKKNVLQ